MLCIKNTTPCITLLNKGLIFKIKAADSFLNQPLLFCKDFVGAEGAGCGRKRIDGALYFFFFLIYLRIT